MEYYFSSNLCRIKENKKRKAEGRRQRAEGKKRLEGIKFFYQGRQKAETRREEKVRRDKVFLSLIIRT
ncbi:MAG: hypothetical protein F6K39_26775 [Okeania sp. SIO3B3]|nr:hypothetical protein [Okeania sp. SIO3B3]